MLHLGCGDGGLTKLVASQGLNVMGVEADEALSHKAQRRGLGAAALDGGVLRQGSLRRSGVVGRFVAEGGLNAILVYTPPGGQTNEAQAPWRSDEAMQEVWDALPLGGRLCMEVPVRDGGEAAAIEAACRGRGFVTEMWTVMEGGRLRAVVQKPGLRTGNGISGVSM